MRITEPMTMITDYILTIFMVIWAFLIINDSHKMGSLFWTIAFVFSGVGALFGGTSHGFREEISDRTNNILWKLATFSIGFTSYFMFLGSIVTSTKNEIVLLLGLIFATLILLIYIRWMSKHDDFIYVIINYGSTMVIIIMMKIYSYLSFEDTGSIWIVTGILVAFIGSYVQATKKSLHEHFNHNDLFHIIQIFSAYLLFKGVIISKTFVNLR